MPEQLTREQVPPEAKWRLEALYPSDTAWEKDYQAVCQLPKRVAQYQGRLAESPTVLAEALRTWFDAQRKMEKVWTYAHLRSDEDLGNSFYQNMMERARSAYIQLAASGAYLAPEILSIDSETIARWLEDEALAPYRIWLEDLLRARPHTLSSAEEKLLSMASEPLATIHRVFSVLKNVDLAARLPQIRDEKGEKVQLSHASFIKLQESRDRSVRREAFQAYYEEFRGNRHTIATALDGIVKTHVFEARVRHFPSALEAALFDDNVAPQVYDALIETVHEAFPTFYRYMELRKRLLGLDKLHMYDIYVPTVPQVEMHYTYEEAVEIVCQALAPLGEEYVETLRQGLLHGWVDRYENVGKRSGAYSSGCYDSWPYILINFTGTLDSVFTLAHEGGHSMHSWYSNRHQPYHLADYRILVAEVASTTNESLLTHYLLSTTQNKAMRAYLIDRYLDSFRATLFRQTMFAEFEKLIHDWVEKGQPLTVDALDEAYYALVQKYFGPSIAFDDEDSPIAWEWARIDHFFYNFYVYKYATGMSAAVALAQAILNEGQPALERYLTFLKSGRSKYPLDLLRDAGVDLATPAPVHSALAEFARLVDELESLQSEL